MMWDWRLERKYSVVGFCSGAVAGLVAITPASGYVGPPAAVLYGFMAGTVCNFATQLKFWLDYDDTLDVSLSKRSPTCSARLEIDVSLATIIDLRIARRRRYRRKPPHRPLRPEVHHRPRRHRHQRRVDRPQLPPTRSPSSGLCIRPRLLLRRHHDHPLGNALLPRWVPPLALQRGGRDDGHRRCGDGRVCV